jgi:hypothetical protein
MFFLLQRFFEYLRVHLYSRDQRIKINTDPVDLVVTCGLSQALLDPLITLLLLLLSCLLSIQAILYLLEEIPQCVDYCDECLRRNFASNSDDRSQYAPLDRSSGILLLAAAYIDGETPTHQSLAELEDCTHNSCTKHIPGEIVQKDVTKCGACGQENCTQYKRKHIKATTWTRPPSFQDRRRRKTGNNVPSVAI